MILEQLGSCEVKNMIPELRHYYALMQAVHTYGSGANWRRVDTAMEGKEMEGDVMDSPSYWIKGINDLLKLGEMPGLNGKLIRGGSLKEGLTQPDPMASQREPRRFYDRQPVVSSGGFRYAEGGVMVEMMESVSDKGRP